VSYSQALEEQIRLMREEANWGDRRNEPNDLGQVALGGWAVGNEAHGRAQVLGLAEPFYWAPDICALMERVPVEVIESTVLRSELFPCDYGFWWFANPIRLPRWDGDGTDMRAILWSAPGGANGTGIELWTYHYFWGQRPIERLSPEGGFMCPGIANFGRFDWRYGETLGDAFAATLEGDYRNEEERELNRQIAADPWHRDAIKRFAAMLLFMDQRILVSAQHEAERHTRKRVQRQGYEHVPLVRVIELRRRQGRPAPKGEHETIAWAHQWIVSGHWRQQWYPSLNANQPRWIMPYVKGPEDKPLKPPRAKVFAVVR
jgi:hypothetical protein